MTWHTETKSRDTALWNLDRKFHRHVHLSRYILQHCPIVNALLFSSIQSKRCILSMVNNAIIYSARMLKYQLPEIVLRKQIDSIMHTLNSVDVKFQVQILKLQCIQNTMLAHDFCALLHGIFISYNKQYHLCSEIYMIRSKDVDPVVMSISEALVQMCCCTINKPINYALQYCFLKILHYGINVFDFIGDFYPTGSTL